MKTYVSVLVVWLFVYANSSAEARIWTDRSGTHKIDAEFVAVQGQRVLLQTTEGRTVAVPIDRLSETDQDFLRNQQQTAPSAAGSQSSPIRLDLLGLHIRKPIPQGPDSLDEMELAMFNGPSEGTSVELLLTSDLQIVGIDEDATQLTRFQDDQKTNLLPKTRQPFGLLSSRIRPDGQAAIVQLNVPGTPAAKAATLFVEGTIVVKCGNDEKTLQSDVIDLTAGGSFKIGPMTIRLKKGDSDFGPMGGAAQSNASTAVTLSGNGQFETIKNVAFLAPDGSPVDTGATWGMEDTNHFEKTYELQKSLAKVKVKVVYFDQIQSVKVPVAAKVGLGL